MGVIGSTIRERDKKNANYYVGDYSLNPSAYQYRLILFFLEKLCDNSDYSNNVQKVCYPGHGLKMIQSHDLKYRLLVYYSDNGPNYGPCDTFLPFEFWTSPEIRSPS